ncbi:DNA polymerase III subunit delta' [Marinomonas mediterranea]|uniref:DNA polymerase III subunit delta' n=1 Tax=Marinomonas mediterranea TaxID=119864 RepID=UPI0023499BF6|nr:DNA polymerase III subunit delta' [Marinomonas mediterranea]WCN09496.1 DNA polymerase III subunit delta' [Marinomonas mediterranea]
MESLHKKACEWRKNGTFHHALMLTGEEGVGQDVLARALADLLMCEVKAAPCGQCHSCQLMAAGSHPDYLFVDGSEGTIKVDVIRQLIQRVSKKAQVGKTKVLLFKDAHAMNINAANAVLKALEEPPENTFFILTTSNSFGMLPTIQSRCQKMVLDSPTKEEVIAWLEREGHTEVSDLFWLTQQPFHLLALKESGYDKLYRALPEKVCSLLLGEDSVTNIVKGVDQSNIHALCDGYAALIHQVIQYSATGHLPKELTNVSNLMLTKRSIYHLMDRYKGMIDLKQRLKRSNLNPVMQLTHELNQW